MLPTQHFLFGIALSLVLFTAFPKIGILGAFLIIASTVLMDIDHYIYYVYKKKDWSLKNAHKWYSQNMERMKSMTKKQRGKVYGGIFFLHGLEILIVLALLAVFYYPFLFILTGFTFHLFLDVFYDAKLLGRADKVSLYLFSKSSKKLKFIIDIKD